MTNQNRYIKKNLPSRADVVIIGGGIVGVSIAYNLAKKGVQNIVLLEKGMLGQGSTGKCAGGIRTQFTTEINIRFSKLSMKVLKGFQTEFGVDPEFHKTGYLFMAGRQDQWKILQSNAELMQSMGLEIELLDPAEILSQWSFLKVNDLLGGSFSKQDGFAGPYEMVQAYAGNARKLGVVIREGIEVTGLSSDKGRVKTVETAAGESIETFTVVNAAGPYASGIAAMLGLDLPVYPLRRQIFFTDTFEELPDTFPMIIDMEYGWYMRREGKGLLLSGPQDTESSFNDKLDFESREWTAERSLFRVPVLENAKIASGWAGLYEISPDHHGIIGSFPEMEGFICANGFSGHGFMHAPATGILVAEIITRGHTESIDIHQLRPARFRENDLIHEPLTAFHGLET